jgi:lysophospholipase L1-like esterase
MTGRRVDARVGVCIAGWLGLVAVVAPCPTAAADPERHAYVVAAIGDSLTDPRSHGGIYLRDLQARCPESRFDSYGVGGQMVNQMHHRFARDVLGDLPDPSKPHYTHVIVFGGVNDLYSDLTAGRTVEKIESDLSAMYRAAHGQGIKVVAMTVTPWGGFHRYYNASRAATTAALNRWIVGQQVTRAVDYAIDAYPLLSCGNPEELCESDATPFKDGLHFGPAGHEKIAEALYTQVFSDCR